MPSDSDSLRRPLARERVIRAAVELADRAGLDAVTMRRLGEELGVAAMSLYKHVADKDDILDGMIELVIGEIEIPEDAAEWRSAMRRRANSAREVLGRHSWAIGLLEARGPTGPTALRYVDAILATLRTGGFSIEQSAHAFWLLDSYVYGHVVQEAGLTLAPPDGTPRSFVDQLDPDGYPYLYELADHALTAGYSFDGEFAVGLELVLDALDRLRRGEVPGTE